MSIIYRAHCIDNKIGWQKTVSDGQIAGTVGLNKPIDAIRIEDVGVPNLGIHAFAHVQDCGWSEGNILNEDIGSTGLNKHIEAIKIGLIGEEAGNYDIWYRCHCANYGWLEWSKNGELNGTVGGNVQVEAVQIQLHHKNEGFSPMVDTDVQFMDLTPQTPVSTLIEIVMNEASQWVGYLAEEDNVFGVENYCIAFVCSCLRKAGIDFINTAWCDDAKYWAIERGRWIAGSSGGQRGFPIAFDFYPQNGVTNHFGIVESVRDDGGYNTIEGNTSGPNGIGIYRKVRYPEDGIEGFINPY